MAHPRASYHERLTVPWWAWPGGLGAAVVLAAQLTIGASTLRHPATYLLACALAGAGLLVLGRVHIQVFPARPEAGEGPSGELWVDDARLPVAAIASVCPVDLARRRDLLGVEADPLAFVIQRPWVPGGVRIDLDDPDDPTPYWFVSSRRPDQLAAAILAANGPTGHLPHD